MREDTTGLHSGRVTQAYSSKHLAIRPRTPMGVKPGSSDPPTEEQREHAAKVEMHNQVNMLELKLRNALHVRTTAHKGDERVFKEAFTKFDTNLSGTVDYEECARLSLPPASARACVVRA